ncbi:hypothetical protein [Pyxidicoccus xibeiensis]|uniref:hypothetical protein n=1 Tax=Pyxidicoccus xibeiensis TaxID=2906759 RepID=UPI0020A77F8C|nr:hypothetical protein [Pyxidicoccus xibeiensis]MCP3143057.1 hypothetical protein [Pyxidicoccus xibeiensis]
MGQWKGMLVAVGLLAGCGGAEEPQLSYAEWSERTAAVMCTHAERCEGRTVAYELCVAELVAAWAAVEPELDRGIAGAKSGCVQCMRIRMEELEVSLASECSRPPDEARVRSVCGAGNEACAGAP